MSEDLKTIILTILGSGAVYSFIQFIVQRWDTKRGLAKKIDNLSGDFEEYKATLARTHILRFADEQRSEVIKHSKEYFQQTILDIDTYQKYCEAHPDFANGLTVMASEYIKDEYKRQYLNNDTTNH